MRKAVHVVCFAQVALILVVAVHSVFHGMQCMRKTLHVYSYSTTNPKHNARYRAIVNELVEFRTNSYTASERLTSMIIHYKRYIKVKREVLLVCRL